MMTDPRIQWLEFPWAYLICGTCHWKSPKIYGSYDEFKWYVDNHVCAKDNKK